ncbi:integrase [Sinorhizobium sp. A49]|uniref:tyrosine-type recombinase/integrase n=1 Tax=Sinorhizobium sp. A49 TaxID=1945861 RepID=UPI00098437DA|nr:integrase arm-type DNA-binding domain-containing protein [Sinorhizobium sp. A49]OOG70035.1 integrase [Sinorhizobium sp. A49]
MATRLTQRTVDAAEPRDARYVIFDNAIAGFGLRISPSGEKSWIFEYRADGGGRRQPKRRVTIGRVGDLTPIEARKVADTFRSQVSRGIDPQAEKVAKRQAPTFAELARMFLAEHVEAKRKATTAAWYTDLFERVLIPRLGALKAASVTRADVAKVHLSLKSTPFQANRALAGISSLYSFADRRGLVVADFNPAKRIEKYREEGRERFLSADELSRLGAAIRQAETDGIPWEINSNGNLKHVAKKKQATPIDPFAAAALRLLIFTGARLREILHLKWQYVDMERGLLLLPDSKTGKKAIVLNAPALEVLAGLPQLGEYVVAGASVATQREKPRADLKRPWDGVRRLAGLPDVRIHDLRHNFAAFGAGGGMGLPIIGKLLGHSQPATTARYAHLDNDPLRRASDAIAAGIAAAMGEASSSVGVANIEDARRARSRDQ